MDGAGASGGRRLPLLVRSAYSFLRGPVMPAQWVTAAADAGYGAVALADWMGLYAALPLLEAAEGRGLRAVVGAELPLPGAGAGSVGAGEQGGGGRGVGNGAASADHGGIRRTLTGERRSSRPWGTEPVRSPAFPSRLLVFCEDLSGYQNLCHILSCLHGAVMPPGRSAIELLAESPGGLLVLCDDPRRLGGLRDAVGPGAVAALLPWPPGPRADRLAREAGRLDLEAVAVPQAELLTEDDRRSLRLLEAIRTGGLAVDQPGLGRPMPGSDEIAARLDAQPQACRAGRRLLERCQLKRADLKPRTFVFPSIGGTEGRDRLRRMCTEGLLARGLTGDARARRRLESELAVIEQLGFVDYFLATSRVVGWARRQGIPSVGRGSGVASLVAYLLFITNVNPVDYGLYFERFLHPLRGDYPDLDIDLAWDRRDEVIAYALEAFGQERAARIGTHHFFRERGAFREAARALGLAEETISRAGRGLGTLGRHADPTVARAARLAADLLDLPRGVGLHPGGIVLADRPVSRIVPLERSANGDVVTQFEMHGVESIGLVKIDLLGNRALGTIAGTLRALEQRGVRIDLERVAHDDERTAQLIATGRTLGCMQLESPAMRGLLRQLRTRSLGGAIHALSLIRPGPASSGMKQAFVRRARGQEAARPLQSAVSGVFSGTYGVPLYEEDIMCLAAEMAGITLAEADMLRRAIGQAAVRRGKAGADSAAVGPGGDGAETGRAAVRAGAGTDPAGVGPGAVSKAAHAEDDLERLRAGFLAAAERQGKRAAAKAAWGEMVRFASYAFCKAHAAGYGVLAYRSAYLKAHYPGPFFAALLQNHRGMYPLRVYVDDARRWGLALRPPCVQRGGRDWRWEPGRATGTLRCGLERVRCLRESTLHAILAARARRAFGDLGDFVARVRPNRAELESLLLSGALDEAWGCSRGELVWQAERILRVRRGVRGRAGADQVGEEGSSASEFDRAMQPALALQTCAGHRPGEPARRHGPWREISASHRARLERRFLGLCLTTHPMALCPAPPRGAIAVGSLRDAAAGGPGRVTVRGVVSATRRHRSDEGTPFFFFTLEDETGLLEAVVRGESALRRMPRVAIDQFVLAEGRLQNVHDAWSLDVARVRILGVF